MSRARAFAITSTLALASACADKAPPTPRKATFPALPRTAAEADALVARETLRAPPAAEKPLDAASILAAAEARGFGTLPSGQGEITRAIQSTLDASREAFLIFGTWHDAPAHIDAFRRLVGPAGLRGISLVAAEQLRADGAWQGAPEAAQRGDDALLEAWSRRGDPAAFAALAERHRDGDYAAWKLGYEETAMDLLVSTRAANHRLVGCDMPARLQALTGTEGDARSRLRELHCLRSLPIGEPAKGIKIAMMWGDAHAAPRGLARFLPPSTLALRVHVVGRRQVPGAIEIGLASRLTINDPVLVMLSADEGVLLLPDETIGGHVDRVLTTDDEGAITPSVIATSEIDGALFVGGRSIAVGREPVTLPLSPGDHTYAFVSDERVIVGAAKIDAGHRVELAFDPDAKRTSYVERSAR